VDATDTTLLIAIACLLPALLLSIQPLRQALRVLREPPRALADRAANDPRFLA
jgi:hypothetical protein